MKCELTGGNMAPPPWVIYVLGQMHFTDRQLETCLTDDNDDNNGSDVELKGVLIYLLVSARRFGLTRQSFERNIRLFGLSNRQSAIVASFL